MSNEQGREEIKGIDPRSYGNFDKFMDKAKRVSKYVLPGVAVALTASCTPEMINAIAKTVETPEVSPLPSDFTKTLIPSPTDANYELTPTVINPATQELTLVSPTEVATEIPTLTLIPEPTATATLEPTVTATVIPTEVAREFPAEVHILSPEELAEKKLYGSGFELKTDFKGIPVDLTIVTSKATLAQYKQTQGCMPNQEMVKYGASSEDRMSEMIFLGHYIGYLRDHDNMKESSYTFEQYIADLKVGADRSYSIWGPRLDGSDGEWRINPLAPVEYVVTTEKIDPDGNGRGTSLEGGGSSTGYQQLENGGMRIVRAIGSDPYAEYFRLCVTSASDFANNLWYLGSDLETLQGRWQLSLSGDLFPSSQIKIRELMFDFTTWNNSNRLIELGILMP